MLIPADAPVKTRRVRHRLCDTNVRIPPLELPSPKLAAMTTGASLRDLMDRMGHDSARAALIYQHKTAAAGRAIADALSAQIESLEQAHSDGTETS